MKGVQQVKEEEDEEEVKAEEQAEGKRMEE